MSDLESMWIVLSICSENKGADQRAADLRICFRMCKNQVFSQRGSFSLEQATLINIFYFHFQKSELSGVAQRCIHPHTWLRLSKMT